MSLKEGFRGFLIIVAAAGMGIVVALLIGQMNTQGIIINTMISGVITIEKLQTIIIVVFILIGLGIGVREGN